MPRRDSQTASHVSPQFAKGRSDVNSYRNSAPEARLAPDQYTKSQPPFGFEENADQEGFDTAGKRNIPHIQVAGERLCQFDQRATSCSNKLDREACSGGTSKLLQERKCTSALVNLVGIMEHMDEQVLPAASRWMGCSFHASPVQIGSITFGRALVQALASPLSGIAGHCYSRIHVLFVGCLLWGTCTLLFSTSTSVHQGGFFWAFNGIGLSLIIPNSQSLIADYYKAESRGTAFGTLWLTGALGGMLGSVYTTSIGGLVVAGIAGWRFAFVSVGLVSIAIGIITLMFASDPHKKPSSAPILDKEQHALFAVPSDSSCPLELEVGDGKLPSQDRVVVVPSYGTSSNMLDAGLQSSRVDTVGPFYPGWNGHIQAEQHKDVSRFLSGSTDHLDIEGSVHEAVSYDPLFDHMHPRLQHVARNEDPDAEIELTALGFAHIPPALEDSPCQRVGGACVPYGTSVDTPDLADGAPLVYSHKIDEAPRTPGANRHTSDAGGGELCMDTNKLHVGGQHTRHEPARSDMAARDSHACALSSIVTQGIQTRSQLDGTLDAAAWPKLHAAVASHDQEAVQECEIQASLPDGEEADGFEGIPLLSDTPSGAILHAAVAPGHVSRGWKRISRAKMHAERTSSEHVAPGAQAGLSKLVGSSKRRHPRLFDSKDRDELDKGPQSGYPQSGYPRSGYGDQLAADEEASLGSSPKARRGAYRAGGGAFAMLKAIKHVVTIPTFLIIILQGIIGSTPGKAWVFLTLYFQLLGMSDVAAGFLMAISIFGSALGGLLGGWLGDQAARKYPNHGRIILAQVSVLIAIPLTLILFKGLPFDDRPWTISMYSIILLMHGLLTSSPAPGCNNPIFAEIVPENMRNLVYAFDRSFEGAVSAAGAPLAGLLAERYFGFVGSAGLANCDRQGLPLLASGVAQKMDHNKATAIGDAMLLLLVLPNLVCALFYSGLHWSYKRDKQNVKFWSMWETI